jgi:hypothetical protein
MEQSDHNDLTDDDVEVFHAGHPQNLVGSKRLKQVAVLDKKKKEVEQQLEKLQKFQITMLEESTKVAFSNLMREFGCKFDGFLHTCQQRVDEQLQIIQCMQKEERCRQPQYSEHQRLSSFPQQQPHRQQQKGDETEQSDYNDLKEDDRETFDPDHPGQNLELLPQGVAKQINHRVNFSDLICLEDGDGNEPVPLSAYDEEIRNIKMKRSTSKKEKRSALKSLMRSRGKIVKSRTSNDSKSVKKTKKSAKFQASINSESFKKEKKSKLRNKVLAEGAFQLYDAYTDSMCEWLVDVERRETGEERGLGVFALKVIPEGKPVTKYQGHMVNPDGSVAIRCPLTSFLFLEFPFLESLPFSRNHSASVFGRFCNLKIDGLHSASSFSFVIFLFDNSCFQVPIMQSLTLTKFRADATSHLDPV